MHIYILYMIYLIGALFILSALRDFYIVMFWRKIKANVVSIQERMNGDSSQFDVRIQYIDNNKSFERDIVINNLPLLPRQIKMIDVYARDMRGNLVIKYVDVNTTMFSKILGALICVFIAHKV